MRWNLLLLALLGMFLFTGCAAEVEAKTPEDLVGEIADNIEQMNDILANVSDVASAKAAAPRLKQLNGRWQEIEIQLKGMDEPDEATMRRIDEVYENRIADSMLVLMEHVIRLSGQPDTMDELADALPFTGW